MTATWDDERVARLADKGGMEGLGMYGLYWRVNEIIAAQMEGKNPPCAVHYTVTRWSLLLSLRGSLVFSALSRLGATGLVTVERDGNDISVTNRNLLKYRDEYSRKSGETPDNIPPRTDGDKDGDGNKETEKYSSSKSKPSTDHEQDEKIYEAYCRHVGKEAALKAIRKAVVRLVKGNKTHPPMDAYDARKLLWKKARQYSVSPAGAKPLDKAHDYRPHPSTWFNQGHYFDDPLEWNKPNGNGANNAAIPTSKAEGDVAVLKESLFGAEYQGSLDENGDLPTGEDRQGEPRTLHGDFEPVGGPPSLPSGDGDARGKPTW
jgi:hypothetical protein